MSPTDESFYFVRRGLPIDILALLISVHASRIAIAQLDSVGPSSKVRRRVRVDDHGHKAKQDGQPG